MSALEKMRLGRTGIEASRTAFGALPIQRTERREALAILRKAYECGINFYDTARGYLDSESKIGEALHGVRDKIYIATKSTALDAAALEEHIGTSLSELRTGYIDIFQFHFAKKCHRPGEEDGLYDKALMEKQAGKLRFIGLTSHNLSVAMEAAASGLYDTVQFPFSHLSSERDLELVKLCAKNDVGFIAMKALAGGLITNAKAAFAFMRATGNALPIWGIQREEELDEFMTLEKSPPAMDDELKKAIEHDRQELSGSFCRGCGYCLPCPADIDMSFSVRMPYALRRMDPATFLTPEWREKMSRIQNCIHCNACKSRCPYELDPPALLEESYRDYVEFAREWDETHAHT